MDVRGISSVVPQEKNSLGFITVLVSAILEWILIFLLFINAIFSYLITRFSHRYKLQTPCLLCSRLDHVLGNEKKGYYFDLVCGNHKSEISSLVLCHSHNKLVDVHGMCENCLFSFATINKSNTETYRLLVGKLGEDPDLRLDRDPLLEAHKVGCSCCNEPWIPSGYSQQFIQTKPIDSGATELDVPLPIAVRDVEDNLKKRRDETSLSPGANNLKINGHDRLSHIGYTELKFASDTESEISFSDNDDDTSAIIHETNGPKEDVAVQRSPMEPQIISLADDLISDKLMDPAFAHKSSTLVSPECLDNIVTRDISSVASSAIIGHGLEEIDWHQVESKADLSALTEHSPPSSTAMETLAEESKASDVTRTEVAESSMTECEDIHKAETALVKTETGSEINLVSNDNGLQISNSLDLGDAYKLAVGNRGRQLSGVLAEQWTGKDSSRVNEDLKLLLSQKTAGRGFEQSLTDMSPKLYLTIDQWKMSDSSNSIGLQILQKRISLERNESGFESLDGSIVSFVSEIEGESVVDRLKRQIEQDRKSMSALYRELEEERNASADATNQAMAMITRLQEEKAALNMEALQYLRMMEEQSEYDMDALQKSNDLLAEKEREIQDLEADLEYYRKRYPNDSMSKNTFDPTCDFNTRDIGMEHQEASYIEDSLRNSVTKKRNVCITAEGTNVSSREKNMATMKNLLSEFEDERLSILQSLEKFEKLLLLSDNGVYSDLANGEYSRSEEVGVSELKEQENSLPVQNDKASIRDEIYDLNDRLIALEADRNFVEHAINSLQNVDGGLKFVQEIASHLRELRRIGRSRSYQPVA